ncbi:MAG TPA: SNF2-related protein [Streptosporangiaceae bacterium]|nr:SNF2-related protein [Streptosporangiaceae bacterium]
MVRALWNPSAGALVGTVRGSYSSFYTTTARFISPDGEAQIFEHGECSCPVGFNCKHVVALTISAIDLGGPHGPGGRDGRRPQGPAGAPGTWERSLASLLEAGNGGPAARRGATPLAIELSLAASPYPRPARFAGYGEAEPGGAAPRLLARLVRPGRNGWVSGGLSWSRLASLEYGGDYDTAHVRLLKEFYGLYKSGGGTFAYPYSYGDEKTIDLSGFESGRLWSLLDEAGKIGLALVHSRKRLGALDPYGQAELCLDVTGGEAGATIRAALVVDDVPVGGAALAFIGTDGHGLVYTDHPAGAGAEYGDRPMRIARLVRPVSAALQRLALEDGRLVVPADSQTRFRDEYYPRLQQMARVTSSDGSFEPPAIPDPTLVLRAAYGAGHDLELSWEWAYEIGEYRRRAPLDPAADTGYRDLDAERGILAGLDAGLEGFGLRQPGPGRPLAARASLGGIETMRFSTEVLPLLDGHTGVTVEISGDPAEYREAGDSLRIAVSATEVAGETDWFDLGVTVTVEGNEVPFADIFVALATKASHLLLPDGAYFSLEKPELEILRRLIDEARALQDRQDGPIRISRFQAGLWDEFAQLGAVEAQAQAWRRQVDGLLTLGSIEPTAQPAALTTRLRPYQADGFGWLAFLWEHRLGGILADDMGLGKTVQSLALICHARQAEPDGAPFLIVAPTSVVANWVAEAGRFAPGLNITGMSDTLRKRRKSLDEVIAGADVVVTSYALFRLDFDAYAAAGWSGLLLDEAQFVKNHQSKAYQCARRLPAPFKLAITGTPMENNLMELWSLLSITAPGLFPSPARFREYYARPIENGSRPDLLAQLRRRIRPLVKRRTKEQVAADLPAKQEQVLEVDLHPRHRTIYQRHLQRERQKILGLIDDLDRNRFTILRSLTLLRQLSLHAGLVDETHIGLPSSKIDALLEQLLDVTGSGHRALVFSQFTGFLGLVRERLSAEGIEHCYLDGRTRDRAAVIERFRDDGVPVFLISLKAGGFGLNLTEADYCFLLDPWWNPATETQAIDRTHRIGQTRNVMVYRLIAAGTIEEKVMALKARKAELFASVMDDGDAFGATLSAEDIRGLFG